MEFIKKVINWFTKKCLEIFQWMEKNRIFCVFLAFGLGLLLGIYFLSLVIKDLSNNTESFWENIPIILSVALEDNLFAKYSTILLALISLPIAFVLWLFRNHDIVMNLDLQMYHEAVRNIHNHDDKKASMGLRQVAFKTLMELKEKWVWGKK